MRGRLTLKQPKPVRGLRDGPPGGGQLHTPTPDAQAHFEQWRARQLARPPEESENGHGQRDRDIVANLVRQSRQRARQPKEQNEMPAKIKLSDDRVREIHQKYYQTGESAKAITKRLGCCSAGTLLARFRKLDLPVSPIVRERRWQPEGTGTTSATNGNGHSPTEHEIIISSPQGNGQHDAAMTTSVAAMLRELSTLPGVQVSGSIRLSLNIEFGGPQ